MTTTRRTDLTPFMTLAGLALFAGCSDEGGRGGALRSSLGYDENSGDLLIVLDRDLADGEVLHTRVRSLAEGDSLDCAIESGSIPTVGRKHSTPHAYVGPAVAPEQFADPTTPETLLGESDEAHADRLARSWFVDICITSDGAVTHEARYDLRQALDRVGANGKFDVDDDGVRIVSNQAYAEACVAEMGDIPFWGERLGDGEAPDYKTISCLEIGTPIPTTLTDLAGNVTKSTKNRSFECDDPQYIYSHCEANADDEAGINGPRVAHARNDQGTHWVLLCRKSHEALGRYEDMAMIGHNPATGKTCFFQNQLPGGTTPVPSNDGQAIPHPADNVQSEASPQQWNDMWMGIQGGIGPNGGIQCAGCHSTDPFIHSPWIDKALDQNGNPVVPKMGHDPDFVEGYNGPYTLLDSADQGWTMPQHLVSDEAAACTKCHRIGRDQWSSSSSLSARSNEEGGCVFCGQSPWLDRLVGEDSAWEGLRTESHHGFGEVFWMPPTARDVLDDELWSSSEFAKSLDFIRKCGANPEDAACKWADLPTTPGDPTELPEVTERGTELATEALTVLGAPIQVDGVDVGSRRCSECHPVSRRGLEKWAELTSAARSEVGIDLHAMVDDMDPAKALAIVDRMRTDGAGTVFSAEKLGVFVAGVQFGYFQKLFAKAFDPAVGPLEYGAFRQRVSMPKGSHPPLSAREFAVLTKWVLDEDLDQLDVLLQEAPAPATCDEAAMRAGVATISPDMLTHIEDMKFDGWAARNQEAGIAPFGCTGDDPLTGCFAGTTEQKSWAAGDIDGVRVVQVRELGFNTSFWTRSSADGRFVGNGGRSPNDSGFGATITDLQTGKDIGVRGSYDPGFFPNNKGFIMQGGGAGLCSQSVLTDATALSGGIDFTEAGCSTAQGINLYQHVAVNLDGGDYFVINSQFTSDSGTSNHDPSAGFSDTSTMKFSPLVHDGETWVQKPAVVVDSPFEGDSVLSPSGRLVISRVAKGDGTAHGYMVRKVNAKPAGDSYSIDIDNALEFLCMPGAKANISFDERFVVTHHYENGVSNLYVADLRDGSRVQVTNMPEGTKALFPHFTSSGWIYFLAKGADGDRLMATDAALRLAAANP